LLIHKKNLATLHRSAVISLFLLLSVNWACTSNTPGTGDRKELLRTGDKLFHQYTCNTCHSLDGEEVYGPPLNGLYMKEVEVIREGKVIKRVADRSYLKKAISDPGFEEVKGYENKDMPEVHIPGKEVDLLVEYLIALDTE
jgi:mono/diheme cytochrome c family protein